MAAQVLLLLLVLCFNTHAEVLRRAGTTHYFFMDDKADFCSVYRWAGEEKELMWNSTGSRYKIDPVAVSHSGQYQEQCWTRGNLTLVRNSTLRVCGTEKMRLNLDAGQRVELKCDGVGPNQSVQWAWDSSGRLELIDEQHKDLLVENSSILLSDPRHLSSVYYSCLVKQQHRCDVLAHFIGRVWQEILLRSVGESLELHCPERSQYPGHAWWSSSSLFPKQVSLNSTLMFPSLTVNHSGIYYCGLLSEYRVDYHLFVCPESEPPAVQLFTGGENLTLHCGDWDQTDGVRWFMRSNRTEGRVSDVQHQPPDNMDPSGSSLVIRNVSLRDSGQFWCVLKRGDLCVFRSETLVMFGEPEVDHLLLRSVLLSAVLLLMLCVVVAVEGVVWRGRRREQVPAAVEEMEMSQLSPESGAQEEAPV